MCRSYSSYIRVCARVPKWRGWHMDPETVVLDGDGHVVSGTKVPRVPGGKTRKCHLCGGRTHLRQDYSLCDTCLPGDGSVRVKTETVAGEVRILIVGAE